MSISGKAAVTDVGDTDYTRDADGGRALVLQLEASLKAIADAGRRPWDIDGIVMAVTTGASVAEDFVTNSASQTCAIRPPRHSAAPARWRRCSARPWLWPAAPRPLCDACHSFACDWMEVSDAAHVHSWTVVHHAFRPAFRNELPTVLATADLAEGVRLLASYRSKLPLHCS